MSVVTDLEYRLAAERDARLKAEAEIIAFARMKEACGAFEQDYRSQVTRAEKAEAELAAERAAREAAEAELAQLRNQTPERPNPASTCALTSRSTSRVSRRRT